MTKTVILISENLEEYIKDMNEELMNKDSRMSEMKVEKSKLEDTILDENFLYLCF